MAFGFTRTLPTITGSHTDFPVLLTAGSFPTAAIDGGASSILNGGGNLRAYTDDTKAVQLPLEPVTFVTGGSPEIEVHVLLPIATTGSTIYLEADDSVMSQPPVTSTYGRNAVWVDYELVTHNSTATPIDSSGKRSYTITGTLTSVTGEIGQANQFTGTQAVQELNSTVTTPTTFTLQSIKKGTTQNQKILHISQGTTLNGSHYLDHRNGRNRFIVANSVVANGSVPTNSFEFLTGVYDGTVGRLYEAGLQVGTTNYNSPLVNTDSFSIGSVSVLNGGEKFTGDIDETRVRFSGLSADWVLTEYDNQSDPANWGTSSAWVDGGGGGPTTHLKTLSYTATGNATLNRQFTLSMLMSYIATGTASLSRKLTLSSVFSYVATGSANIAKTVKKGLSYNATGTSSTPAKKVSKTLEYTATGTCEQNEGYVTTQQASMTATGNASLATRFIAKGTAVASKLLKRIAIKIGIGL